MSFFRKYFGKSAKGEKVESAKRNQALRMHHAESRGSENYNAKYVDRYNFAEYQVAGTKDRTTRGATAGPKVDTSLKQMSVPLRSPHNQSSQNRNVYPETSSGQKRSGWERRPAATHPSLLQERTNPQPQAGPQKAARNHAPASQKPWCDPSLLSGRLSGKVPRNFQGTTGLQALASFEKTYREMDEQLRGDPDWEAYIRRADH